MSVSALLWRKAIHRRYENFPKIREYYLSLGSLERFSNEMARRCDGGDFTLTKSSFAPHNPVCHVDTAMRWIVERYQAIFEHLDIHKPKSILEVGSGYGLSCWLMSDVAEKVVGLDHDQSAIDTASRLFPEAEFYCADFKEYLTAVGPDEFDVIIDVNGPLYPTNSEVEDLVMSRCERWYHGGYRARGMKEGLTWSHKMQGQHLSFSTTVRGDGFNGIALNYPKFYLSWSYALTLKHALRNGYFWPT